MLTAPGAPDGGAVGEDLDEQVHLPQGRVGAQEAGHRLVDDGEELHDEVVPGTEVGALVGEDRRQLVGAEPVEGALRQDDATAYARDAVGGRGRVLEDAHVPVGALAGNAEQVDEVAVAAAGGAQVAPDPVAREQQPHGDDAAERGRRRPA